MTKARKRRKPEQIAMALAEGEAMLSAAKISAEVYQKLGIAESAWMRSKQPYGGMKSAEAKRLRELQVENRRANDSFINKSPR